MVHKVEVGGKEYEFNRPVIAVERKVRALTVEMAKAAEGLLTEDGFAECQRVWREIAGLVLKDADEAVLDYGQMTDGESADICAAFFAAARRTNEKPPAG